MLLVGIQRQHTTQLSLFGQQTSAEGEITCRSSSGSRFLLSLALCSNADSPRRRRAELVPPRYPSLPGRWCISDHPEVLLLAELHTNASVVGAMLTLTPGDAATCTMYVEFSELMLVTILRSTTNLAPFLKDTVIEG
jgi:hypothetical protein